MSGDVLHGYTVVTTRDERGRLDSLLAAAGADIIHVPLIEIVDRKEAASDLTREIGALGEGGWVVVTSRHGARRVGALLADRPALRLAAVGHSTAAVLSELVGRRIDIVPSRQTAVDLVAAMPEPSRPGERLVLAQADRAADTAAAGLVDRGYDVVVITAYENRLRQPTSGERRAALAADVLALASGSAAEAWVAAFGEQRPPMVVAIGPATERTAREVGLQITHVATDHSVEGLAAEIAAAVRSRP